MSFLPALISAGGAIGAGLFSRPKRERETSGQKRSREVIDELLSSMRGQGPYSDLFNTDEAAFQKSFVQPALSRFENQVAPQIQQSFIAGGQQRGTGLENKLTQAGVDMDQLLNQHYADFQNKGLNRQSDFLSSILQMQGGAAPGQSFGNAFQDSFGGYLSSDAFGDLTKQIGGFLPMTPKGFFPDWGGK